MAVFEPTEDEKSAASYLDWDDAMLGKFTKYCGLVMEKNSKDAEGLHRVAAASCAMQLVSACLDSNAATLTLKLDGHTHSGVATGDWIVTVKRRKASPAFALRILRPRPARQCVRKLHEHGIEVSQARPTPAEGTDMSKKEEYLGDGLYASFDGWQFCLRAPRENGDHVVYLEPFALRQLNEFAQRMMRPAQLPQESASE